MEEKQVNVISEKHGLFQVNPEKYKKVNGDNRQDNTQVGEKIAIYFHQGKKGHIPIGRTEKGKIVLITMSNKTFIKYGSSWMCHVESVDDRKVIVSPLYQIATAEENEQEISTGVEKLVNKFKKEDYETPHKW